VAGVHAEKGFKGSARLPPDNPFSQGLVWFCCVRTMLISFEGDVPNNLSIP
jgi:hypothetical protein